MKRTSPPSKLSEKRRKALGGRRVFSTIVAKGKRPKPRNAKRRASEFERCYHSLDRVVFVNHLPCASCGAEPTAYEDRDFVEISNAHTRNGGMSRKGGYKTIVPLCVRLFGPGCHGRQHQHGWSVLPALDTPGKRQSAAARTEAAWLASLPPTEASRT